MKIELQKFRSEEWQPISQREARWIILRQLATSGAEAGILLDDLKQGAILDCGTRGKLRKKPRKKRNAS